MFDSYTLRDSGRFVKRKKVTMEILAIGALGLIYPFTRLILKTQKPPQWDHLRGGSGAKAAAVVVAPIIAAAPSPMQLERVQFAQGCNGSLCLRGVRKNQGYSGLADTSGDSLR